MHLYIWLLGKPTSTPIPTPTSAPTMAGVQAFDNTWLPVIVAAIQLFGLLGLAAYVILTHRIAQANRTAAEAAVKATESALASVEISRQTVQEMKEARDAETAPHVVVYLDGSSFLIRLLMENIGPTTAYDITLTFKPELRAVLRPNSMEWPAFMTGTTPMLAPTQSMQTFINTYPALLNNPELQPQYVVTVEYYRAASETKARAPFISTYVLDVNSFRGMRIAGESDAEKTNKVLDKLIRAVDDVKKATEGASERLNVGITVNQAPSARVEKGQRANIEEGIRLTESLEAQWKLLCKKKEDRAVVTNFQETLIERTSERLTELVPYMPLAVEDLANAQTLAMTVYDNVNQVLNWYIDVTDEDMYTPLAALRALLLERYSGLATEEVTQEVTRKQAAIEESEHARDESLPVQEQTDVSDTTKDNDALQTLTAKDLKGATGNEQT